ncbi:MAG: LysR family transcriptional regulator [Xanthomonadales bacterium]|nr:LysR family transcriptional regulator [Xanthomonadales bacterium]
MQRKLPSLNALRAFEATVRLGGASRAAEALHVTHGAISRQLRLLEDELGVELFQRHGRNLIPTPAARRLADVSGNAFESIVDAIGRMHREQSQHALVLGCSASVLARWIIPRLPQLQAALPQLPLHLSAQESTPDAALSGLDAALLLAEPPWPATWALEELAVERIGPVLAREHPAAHALQGQPAHALLAQALLHTHSRPQAWPLWARAHGLDPEQLRLGTGFDHLYYLLEAASAGLGIAIAPEPLVRADLAAGRLIAPWGFVSTSARWLLCWPADRPDPRFNDLAQWLSQALAE